MALFYTSALNTQERPVIGIVTYKTGRYIPIDLSQIEDNTYRHRVKKVFEIEEQLEYKLQFDREKSMFRLHENPNLNRRSQYVILAEGLQETIYRDSRNKQNIRTTLHKGKRFKLISKLQQETWEISSEFKLILGYKCHKATIRMEFINPITKKNDVFYPVVWFSYALPVPFGPHLLNGLPGLVLEGTYNGRTYFYATKIELNTQEPLSIKIEDVTEVSEVDYVSMLIDNFIKRQKKGGE